MTDGRPRSALVLSGGGARGAYEAGVVTALFEREDFEIVCGTSIGSINAALAAQGATDQLRALWRGVPERAVIRGISPFEELRAVLRRRGVPDVRMLQQFAVDVARGLGALRHAHPRILRRITHVLDPAPVIAMLAAVLDFTRLERTLVLGVTNLTRARPEAFCYFPPADAAFENDFIAAEPTSVPLRAENYLTSILASAAIPLAFPKVPLADRDGVVCDYIDGGVGNNTPIRQAIDAGADEITVVIADHLALRDRDHRFDDLGSIALVAQDILQQQVLELDLKLTRRVNEAVRRGAAPGKRFVRVRTIGPSVAIPLPILGFADLATIDRAFDQGLIDGRGACDATGLSNLFATDPGLRRLAAGDRLFTEGDPGDEMFVIVEGEIALSIGGRTLTTAATGDVVGELALLGAETRRVSAHAVSDAVVAPVDRDRFGYLVRYAPSFALIVLRALAEILHHMGHALDSASESLTSPPSAVRPSLRLEAFRNDPSLRSLVAGETIFAAGDPATALYLVLEGSVEVRGDGPTRRADASDFFGEMALCDCEPHEAEAIAVTAAQVVPIDVMRFTSIVQNDPSFAIDVMHALAARILSRFEVAPVS